MNLAHVQAVLVRIEEIRRRFGHVVRPERNKFEQVMETLNKPMRPGCSSKLEPVIARAASRNKLDPDLIKAVIQAESGFRTDAVSKAGAMGLMQLMPQTAQELGVDPMDPEEAIEGGARYLRQQLDRFGDIEMALAAYNAGPGAVARYGDVPPYAETRRFVSKVLRYYDAYSE